MARACSLSRLLEGLPSRLTSARLPVKSFFESDVFRKSNSCLLRGCQLIIADGKASFSEF